MNSVAETWLWSFKINGCCFSKGTTPGASVLTDGAAVYTPGLSENRGGTSAYYANDRLGNLWTLNSSGGGQLTYEDTTGFGTLTAGGGSNPSPFKFGGGNGCQTDSDFGLVLMGHRYYDTRIGRFLTQDPAGDGDNWYAYCDNSPVNGVDPDGLDEDGPDDPTQFSSSDGSSPVLSGYDPNDPATNIFNPDQAPIITVQVSAPKNNAPSYSVEVEDLGFGGWVDQNITFGTVGFAANTAGLYDSGKASRGAAIGAGALAVGAILLAATTDGEDAAAADAEQGVLHVVDHNLPKQLAALLEKEGINAISVQRALGATADDLKDIVPYIKANNAKIITKDLEVFEKHLPARQIIHIPTGNASGRAADLLNYLRPIIGF